MTSEFIPYDLALRLKAIGFDEPCLAIYSNANPKTGLYTLKKYRLKLIKQASQKDKGVKAPTWNSAFDWFRENYPYRFYVLPCSQHEKYLFEITLPSSIFYTSSEDEAYSTYKESRQALLTKLIEIVESKQK